MIKPLNNHCLIEVIDDYEGVVGSDAQGLQNKGVLRNFTLATDHLTASVGYEIEDVEEYGIYFKGLVGKVVYWEEYADAGKKFTVDGKQYVLIPFYRLIGVEE